MPQTIGAGTVYTGGPGSARRGPFVLKTAPGDKGQNTWVQLFDASGNYTGPAITSTYLDPTTIQYLKLVLTAAQVKALNGTPVSVVAAPGTGKMIQLMDAAIFLNFNSASFAAGSTVQVKQGTVVVATTTAALMNGGSSAFIQLAFPALGTTQSNGGTNSALTITASGSEFTTGDSTVTLHIWYAVVTAA